MVRGKTIIEKNKSQDEIENIASQLENVKVHMGDNEIKKSIYVKDKLINFVI
jgi:leucyl-tRNA synthetase